MDQRELDDDGAMEVALQRFQEAGEAGFEEVCGRLPDRGAELRRRFQLLEAAGLLPQPAITATASSLESGRVAHYRLLRELGIGGMGAVYLAYDEQLKRECALKLVPASLHRDPRARERFEREVRAIAQLAHPGIATVYGWGECGGIPYFTMEHVDGPSCAKIVRELRAGQRKPPQISLREFAPRAAEESWYRSVARIGRDIAQALEHAHARGIVHRDIKPGNLLVNGEGSAHLIDFGLASYEADQGLTATGVFLGTSSYAPPEQLGLLGDRQVVGPTGDVYSLGVSLYELLTLEVPFQGDSAATIFHRIATREPDRPRKHCPGIPADLETIVLHAMAKDPAERYPTAQAMAEDLDAFLRGRTIEARPASFVVRAYRLARTHPGWALAAMLTLLFAILAPWQLASTNRKVTAERDIAMNLSEDMRRAEAFVRSVFELGDLEELGPDTTMKEAMVVASGWLLEENQLAQSPRSRVMVLCTFGPMLAEMGERDLAERLLISALELHGEADDLVAVEVARAENALANLCRLRGDTVAAEQHYAKAAERMERLGQGNHANAWDARLNLYHLWLELNRLEDAETLLQRLAEHPILRGEPGRARAFALEHAQFALALRQGRLDEAHDHLSEASQYPVLEWQRGEPAGVARDLGKLHQGFAELALARGDAAGAYDHNRRSLEAYLLVDEATAASLQILHERLVLACLHMGDFPRAMEHSLQHLESCAAEDVKPAGWGLALYRHALILENLGRPRDAAEFYGKAGEVYGASGAAPGTRLELVRDRARCLEAAGDPEGVRGLTLAALESWGAGAPGLPVLGDIYLLTARAHQELGNPERAADWLWRCLEHLDLHYPPERMGSRHFEQRRQALGELAELHGNGACAGTLRWIRGELAGLPGGAP